MKRLNELIEYCIEVILRQKESKVINIYSLFVAGTNYL